jgi:hypothetical protein
METGSQLSFRGLFHQVQRIHALQPEITHAPTPLAPRNKNDNNNGEVVNSSIGDPADFQQLVCAIMHTQHLLAEKYLAYVHSNIQSAAMRGQYHLIIGTFDGHDRIDIGIEKISLLFLVKGCLDYNLSKHLKQLGFVTLLDILQKKIKPFEVDHVWVPGTTTNHIVIRWSHI